MEIRAVQANDYPSLIQLIAEFRLSLAELRGQPCQPDHDAASQELAEYVQKSFPIYVAEDQVGQLAGYLVCRVDGDVVWAEALYVLPQYRRQGIGSALYAAAERLAQDLGGDTLYNWIDPNNHRIIHFLRQRGYTVLNLLELRRPRPDEQLLHKISLGKNQFDIP